MKQTLFYGIKTLLLFLIGGIIYYLMEIFARGHSHYSMFIAGGLSLAIINIVCNNSKLKNKNIFLKAIISGFLITTIELVIGIVFNIFLKMNVWDYSSIPLNVLGQICIPFTALWILLSFPAIFLCKLLNLSFEKIVNYSPQNKDTMIQ